MGECDKFGRGGRLSGSARNNGRSREETSQGTGWGNRGGTESEMPQTCAGGAGARHDNGVVMMYSNRCGVEGDATTRITELTDREERSGSEGWHNMDVAGGERENGEIKLGFMRGIHDGAIRVGDADRIGGGTAVDDMCIDGAEMRGASAIG